jgi:hypothetical protein
MPLAPPLATVIVLLPPLLLLTVYVPAGTLTDSEDPALILYDPENDPPEMLTVMAALVLFVRLIVPFSEEEEEEEVLADADGDWELVPVSFWAATL